jgi:hypothetical protein
MKEILLMGINKKVNTCGFVFKFNKKDTASLKELIGFLEIDDLSTLPKDLINKAGKIIRISIDCEMKSK